MKKESINLIMSDGYQIVLHRWIPDGAIRAVLQISHGMAEYALRYDRIAELLNAKGIVVYAHDHRGHGESAPTQDDLGYLADKNGFNRVTEDLCTVIAQLKKDFPDKKTFLLGHSFGSFISQNFIEQFAERTNCHIDGCILSGSAGPRLSLTRSAKILALIIVAVKGSRYRSKFLHNTAFGNYNAKIMNPISENDWLSRDVQEVATYDASPFCGFVATAGFFKDLFTGLSTIHTRKRIKAIPHHLPLFLLAGTDDPVGDYGNTVEALAQIYRKEGITDVTLTLYPGGRHEMLNEINKDEVSTDIISWLEKHL